MLYPLPTAKLSLATSHLRQGTILGSLLTHLAHDILVGEAHDHAVLGRVVLVLVLGDQAQACAVVGLTLSPALVLDLWGSVGQLIWL